ncbi:uncharacterized protein [Panulirus ornatus]|uniref:uncharacterized protein n=1 Tax=Panulirus ornatus TaxID=150431 RepID=UPI003A85327F
MSGDSGRRVCKVRGGGLVTGQPTTVTSLAHTSTESNLLRVPPVVVQSQTGVTLMQSTVLHTKSLMHADAQPEAHSQVHTQSQTHIQSQTQVQPQPLLQTQSQVLPLTQGDNQTAIQSQTQTHSLSQLTPRTLTQSLQTQTHSLAQMTPRTLTQSLQTQTHSLAQLTPRTLTQSLVYSNPHVLTQSQVNTQSQMHTQSQVHTQSQINTQSHMHLQPQLHTQSQIQVQSLTPAQPHIQVQSQLTQMPLQTQLPTLTHASVISTMADLVDAAQIENSSPQHTAKTIGGLEVMQVPVTRQHSSPSVSLQDLHSSSVSINDELPNNSQAQLMHTLTTFPQPEHLNTTAGLQQGNVALSQTLPQPLTQTQILDAFTVERVLMSSRNSLGQASIPPVSSVEIDGISVMRVQEGFNTRPNNSPPLVTSAKESSNHSSPAVTQLACSQRSTPLLDNSHLEASQLGSLHSAPQDNAVNSLSKKPATTTTTSTLIASNRMLNKLLDTAKPHIPSQVTKAAEIAHLVPNPSVRLSSTSRLGDMDDVAEMVFTTSSRGSSPLTTLTRSSGASMCTVTGALRGSSGHGDSVGKAPAPLQLDGIFGLPSHFPLNNTTLVLPGSISHSQIIPQRQFDTIQQVLLGSQNMTNTVEQQMEGLNTESLRILPTSLNANQQAPVTTCSISGNNNLLDVSSVDKNSRKTGPSTTSQVVSNTKMFNVLGLPEGLNKSGVLLDSPTRSHSNPCTKASLITSTDPMFPSVVVTSGCCSPIALGTVSSRLGSSPQEGSCRVRCSNNDARVSHQTLVDLLSRGPSSETVAGGGGSGIPLIGLSESRLPHTGDVLLSELHRSDESDLSLSASLTGTSGEELHSNPSGLVTEASLVTGIGGDTAPLHGLPSPPLPSFSLPIITADLLGGGVSGSKTCPSGQGPLPALLSNLATTADLDQFLENSNMCIDMSSLSESEVSLSTGPGAFAYSPEKPCNSKKSVSGTSSELTFTNALKAATTKSDSEQVRLRSESESPSMILHQDQALVTETAKALHVDVSRMNSVSCTSQTSPVLLTTTSDVAQEMPIASSKKTNAQVQTKPSQGHTDKRKEMFRKNELLVQQVACFKCRLCSYLSQDKSEMVNHMKEQHSQYLSDTDESEEEVEKLSSKRVKVLVPRADKNHSEESVAIKEPTWCVKTKGQKRKVNPEYKMEIYNSEPGKLKNRVVTVEEEQLSGRIGIFIKTEPKDVGEFEGGLLEKEEEEDLGLTIELGETTEPGSDRDFDDEDTNDSSTTNDSGSIRPSNKKPGRPLYSKTTGITKFKKKNPKVTQPDEVLGIRCDVNGCGLRMKSENNIAYHRKCHVNNKLKCQECSCTKFQSWSDLALHLWKQHLIDMELHKCDKCDYKSYSYSKLMNIHHKIHSDERPSLCDTCGKRFKTVKQLRNHKALHMKKSEAPQHQCEICQRVFSDKRMLHNHQEFVHKKVKPFLCNYCGYSTASRSTLKMHMRQHTGEKPFACEICKYRTSDHNSLRRHKMQHTGVRPYRCPYCDYASIQCTTFKVHLKDKHPGLAQLDGIMFTCGVCSFKTVKRDNYLAHVAEHSRCENKKQRQTISSTSVRKTESPQAILSDLTPPPPHVVNIDVDSGTVTVESPHDADYLNAVHVQTPVPGQVLMAGDQYIYATVDSSVLSQVRSGEGVVHLTQDMVGVPISIPLEASASSLQGLVYVATTSQGGQ